MKTYTLTASLPGMTNTVSIQATDDTDAVLTAAFKVLSVAPASKLWATGLIELRDPDNNVIERMPSKMRGHQ